MASFTVKIKKQRKDGTRPVRIRITHNYTECELGTVWAVTDKDLKKGEIKNMEIADGINGLLHQWRRKLAELGTAAQRMTAREIGDFLTEKRIDNERESESEEWKLDIFAYTEMDAQRLEKNGSEGTAGIRRTALRSLQNYLGRQVVDVNEITATMLNGWVQWLCEKNGTGCRAASLYPTQLRAVFNRARREFNTDDVTRIPNDPFSRMEHVRMPASKPRSITAEQIKAIAALPDCGHWRVDLARDVFMLSFYLMGMNSVDLYQCPPIKDGRVTYERAKTRTRRSDNALISVAVPKKAEPLIAKYAGHRKDRAFVFCERYSNRTAFSAALNTGLKEVGRAIGVQDLQFYAARHSWATIAVNDAGVDKYTVHQALNHVDGKTAITDIYIRKSWEPLDAANRKVLDYVWLE